MRDLHRHLPAETVVLFVDHLDRLDEDPCGPYWLDQLVRLPPDPWLHVVCACRTDEYSRAISPALGPHFIEAQLEVPPALFAGGEADPDGRVRAPAVERGLARSHPEIVKRFAAVAFGMGVRRRTKLPSTITSGSPHELDYRGEPAIVHVADGSMRFVHDALQDLLCAIHFASELAQHVDSLDTLRALVSKLAEVPRDVTRTRSASSSRRRVDHGIQLGGSWRTSRKSFSCRTAGVRCWQGSPRAVGAK